MPLGLLTDTGKTPAARFAFGIVTVIDVVPVIEAGEYCWPPKLMVDVE